MRNADHAGPGPGPEAAVTGRPRASRGNDGDSGWIIETVVSPFHCLYQDALDFHKQSHLRLPRSEAEASRLARAALLLYLESAESLVRQAAAELARPELVAILTDPTRPVPTLTAWTLLPALVGDASTSGIDPEVAPWPAFAELMTLRTTWSHPGPVARRRAYYHSARKDGTYEPLQPHQAPPGLEIAADRLILPRTGLPLDPYALRPRHLDTARSVLDQAIDTLDRRLGGALTKDFRHRKEPARIVHPRDGG